MRYQWPDHTFLQRSGSHKGYIQRSALSESGETFYWASELTEVDSLEASKFEPAEQPLVEEFVENWVRKSELAEPVDVYGLESEEELCYVRIGNARMQVNEDPPVVSEVTLKRLPAVEKKAPIPREEVNDLFSNPPFRKHKGKKNQGRQGREIDDDSRTTDPALSLHSKLDTGTAHTEKQKAGATRSAKIFLSKAVLRGKSTGVVHIPPIPDTLVQTEAEWDIFERMIRDPDLLKILASHPSTKRFPDDVDLAKHISVLRNGLDGLVRDRSFDLLLYDCMYKYGLSEALSLFGSFENQLVVKGISEALYQLKSLEDGSAAQEIAKTEIGSAADKKVERTTPEPTETARRRPPSASPPSNEDYSRNPGEHATREFPKMSVSSLGKQATSIRDKLTSPREEAHQEATRINERLNGPRALRLIEATPQIAIPDSKRNLMVSSRASDIAKDIAAEAKRHASAMKTFAFISALFLPGTFVAAVCTILFL